MQPLPDLSRVLILATHPDDDVIGAGGLIQRSVAAGGTVRVLFITGGESNEWPQRAMLRKWRITAADRQMWADLRRREAECSLERVGASRGCASFLGYPDQQVGRLARENDMRLLEDLRRHAEEFRPTLVVSPSFFDQHTDHRATSWYAHQAFGNDMQMTTYLVHGDMPTMRTLFTLHLTPEEQQKKREAIAAHASQLILSRRRFLEYARATETFLAPEFDVVHIDSMAEAKLAALRHSVRAVLGALRR